MIGYTTIEQSKKLVELGIDVDTCDMHYNKFIDEDDSEYEIHCNKLPKLRALYTDYLPCWSTEALLKLLPREINRTDNYILDNILVYPNKGYCISYRNVSNYEYKEQIMSVSDTLLECAYEMIDELPPPEGRGFLVQRGGLP